MKTEPIFKRCSESIKNLFKSDEGCTFLAGAGVSMDAPSNMPSARQFVRSLLSYCGLESELEKMMGLPLLRYELVVEWIQKFFDPELTFMNYFEQVIHPNLIHFFLAQVLVHQHYVITTNFDYLIEFALLKTLGSSKRDQIVPVITKQDFLASANPEQLYQAGRFPLYKIHGSRKNIIMQANTQESMITTISALGKEREEGKTFAIEPFKKPAMYQLLKDRTLVVFGYSGSDDFDLSPILKEVPFLKRLIWVDHANTRKLEILRLNRNPSKEEYQQLSRVEKFLCELHDLTNYEILLIRAPTGLFVQKYLWPVFIPKQKLKKGDLAPTGETAPPFHTWAKPIFSNVEELAKYQLTLQLYLELKELNSVQNIAQKALELATQQDNPKYNGFFTSLLGMVKQIQGDYPAALAYYESAYEIEQKDGDEYGQASALNNIGGIYNNLGEYEKAKQSFEKALQGLTQPRSERVRISLYLNLGYLQELMGNNQGALNHYTDAARIAEKTGDLNTKITCLNNQGLALDRLGNKKDALEKYNDALRLVKQLGDIYGKVLVQNNIARMLDDAGNTQGALDLLHSSLILAEQLGDLSKKAGILSNIGSIFKAAGHYDEALENYKSALDLEQKVGNVRFLFTYWNNIGETYLKQEKLPLALSAFQQALPFAEKSRDKSLIAVLMSKLGNLHTQVHQLDQALTFIQGAANLYKEIGDTENYAACQSNLSQVYMMAKDWGAALSCVTNLLEIDLKLQNPLAIAMDYKRLGDIKLAVNDVPNARKNYQNAIGTLEAAHDEANGTRLKEYVQNALGDRINE